MILISIITICYNNAPEVIATSESVDAQILKPHEHIIIDGSTADDIRKMLQGNNQPSYRKWISEPDRGIADAFNKGIINATGNVVVMLNSGDLLYNENVLEIVTREFMKYPGIFWIHGKYKLVRGKMWVIIGKAFEKKKLYRGMRSICHQTMFVKKELHTKFGLYDVKEKIAMDYDFLCRIADEPFRFIDVPLVVYAPGGTSSANYLQSLKDAKSVYERNRGKTMMLSFWQIRLKFLHYLLHSALGTFLYKIKTRLKLENT